MNNTSSNSTGCESVVLVSLPSALAVGVAFVGISLLGARAGAQVLPGEQCVLTQYLPSASSAGSAVTDIVAGDIDHDGDLDMLTADGIGGLIRVFVNNGGLGFAQHVVNPAVAPRALTLGDADSDGDLDLLLGFGSGMRWFANDGAGNFVVAATFTLPAGDSNPIDVRLVDVNEDGRLDAVLGLKNHPIGGGATAGGLWVALGDGAGGFQPLPTNELALHAFEITLADFNGDGHLDVATLGGNISASTVSIADGLGDGTFASVSAPIPVGIYAGGLASGDFDRDGDVDLATGFKYWLSIRLNDGAGAFTLTQSLGVGSYVKGIAVGDLDRDGDIDLIATSGSASAMRLATNDSSGHFTVTGSVPTSIQCYSVLLADTGGDGYLDAWAGDVVTGQLFSAKSHCIVARYGQAKLNSSACRPAISSSGAPSLSAALDDFHVTASNVLNNKSGILFWGTQPAATVFHGGVLSVQPPLVRTDIQVSGGQPPPDDCSGTYDFHFSRSYMQQHLMQSGDAVFAQYWSRDPGFIVPDNIGLTDALRIVIQP